MTMPINTLSPSLEPRKLKYVRSANVPMCIQLHRYRHLAHLDRLLLLELIALEEDVPRPYRILFVLRFW